MRDFRSYINQVTSPSGPPVAPIAPERPTPPRVNHLLHGVLAVATGGLWSVVWVLLVADARNITQRLELGYQVDLNRHNRRVAAYNRAVETYVARG